jgi:hypothetical protein
MLREDSLHVSEPSHSAESVQVSPHHLQALYSVQELHETNVAQRPSSSEAGAGVGELSRQAVWSDRDWIKQHGYCSASALSQKKRVVAGDTVAAAAVRAKQAAGSNQNRITSRRARGREPRG